MSVLPSVPEWLRPLRDSAAQRLAEVSWPTSAEEVWRYSRVDDLVLDSYRAPNPPSESPEELAASVAQAIRSIGACAAIAVTVNGYVTHLDARESLLAKGFRMGGAKVWTESDVARFGVVAQEVDAFVTTNATNVVDPIIIDIPRGIVINEPIVVLHYISSDAVVVVPRVVVNAGENSNATVVEYFLSDDVSSLVIPVTELDVAQAANLHYLNVQLLGKNVNQVAYQASRVERDATFTSTAIALGGSYARVRTGSRVVGRGATSKLRAAYFGDDSQMHDFRTLQGHEAPKTTSDLLFKGAVGNQAQSVYSGLIRVRKGAAGTNAYQTNRNLVLSDGAHASSVPNLEIEENDVKCSHASAVGPVDEDQLYYLESRGVPSNVATELIILGFINEILEDIPIAGLREPLREIVSQKLENVR